MNFSEFKKLIGADPSNRDPETLRARNSAPEFEQAAAEAEAFEEKLHRALCVPPPGDLMDAIKDISRQPVSRRQWMPFAMAASLLIAVGAMGIAWKQSRQWASIEAYLADHYSHDGAALIARASSDGVSAQEINQLLAGLGAAAEQPLSDLVKFIKYCPTPEGKGAHMVVSTAQGPVTIIFMPDTRVNEGDRYGIAQMQAYLVNLEHGSAAIIGRPSQTIESLEAVVRGSLKTGVVST